MEGVRMAAAAALASIEANRRRIDDLNVYPVPDGDTGTNLTLTVRAVVESLADADAEEPEQMARAVTRAALMGARGNSGVILSQIVRGAAEALSERGDIDPPAVAAALRAASDAAYRAVRKPVEGTMLTVVRELAEEAERRAAGASDIHELLSAVIAHGEEALARTPEQLAVLREAGVVDAGGAGLLEIVRGIAAGLAGEPLPAPAEHEELSHDAIHQELSRFRYCTVFVVEGEELNAAKLETVLEPLGDSLLVVGDRNALKIHLHTDDPGAALAHGTAAGTIEQVEIANMHKQTVAREERLASEFEGTGEPKACSVVAVASGEGNRRLFASLGADFVIDGGRTMNPSTEQILAAIERTGGSEVVVLPNNSNVVMSAEQAARLASKPVRVVRTDSLQEGLAALVVYAPDRSAESNTVEMYEALDPVETGAVTVASRDAELNGVAVRKGKWLGLVDGDPVATGDTFEEVAEAVVERLLTEPKDILTLLTGEEKPELDALRRFLEERHPELELDVQEGGQPHYPLLLSAE
jgi:DAK2 domain fusion protein YloV